MGLQKLNHGYNEALKVSALNVDTDLKVGGGGNNSTLNVSGSIFADSVIEGTSATAARGIGYTGMPQLLNFSPSYEIKTSDAGKHIYNTLNGSNIVIPANNNVLFPIGTSLAIVNQAGVTSTISISLDTLAQAGTGATGTRTLGPYAMATILKVGPQLWMISGVGVT
jgi:hypothetical protein